MHSEMAASKAMATSKQNRQAWYAPILALAAGLRCACTKRGSFNGYASAISMMLLFASTVHAQKYLGTLSGEVADTTRARIVGATVTATDVATKFSTKVVSNNSGSYSISFLTPDTYDITVEKSGFRTETRVGVVLSAGGDVRTDFTLNVGSPSQTVTVNATGEFLDTATADLAATFSTKQVTDLPSVDRNPFMVAALAAGAYDNAYMVGKASGSLAPSGGGATAINGNGVGDFGGGGRTRVTIDGVPDDPSERIGGSGGNNYTGLTPSPEAVQEVKVQTVVFDAEFGRGGGTEINTVLRSGTNTYHGALYYEFRNTYLNSNLYERAANQDGAVNPAAPTHRPNGTWNQPGFVLDGPVRIPHIYNGHDKTFFMFAYERFQQRQYNGNGAVDLVPTAAQDGGDFSALCPGGFDSNGVCNSGGIQIYDPLTLDASNNRTPFPNNLIPASRVSPVGKALLKLYPAPNANQSPTVNYLSIYPLTPVRYYSITTRVDQSINADNKFSATFYTQILNQINPNQGFPTKIGPSGSEALVHRDNHGGSLDYISTLPHGFMLDARAGVINHPFGVVYAGSPYDLSTLGISSAGMAYQTFPGVSFSDSYTGLQAGAGSQTSGDTFGSGSAILSTVIGKHDLHFGFQGELTRYYAQSPFSGLGNFNFDRRFTQKNSVNTAVGADPFSGNALASLLLGYPSGGSYGNQVSVAIQQIYQAYFIEDNWRVSPNLTFNLGLRWDYEAPYTERHNQLNTGFCTTCTNPLQASVSGLTLRGGLQFASSSNRGYYRSEYGRFQPRFGVSYQLPERTRTVVHTGVGLFYVNSLEGPLTQGFSATTNYVATNDNTHPATSFASPFPSGVNPPTGSSLGLATQIGQGITFPAPNYVNPRILQWTLSTQTELPGNMVLQLAYAGNRTWDWEVSKNINALPAQYYNQGPAGITYLQTPVPNPMAGQIPTNGTLNGATIQRQFLLLPFPEFGGVTESFIPSGGALYNALQVTVNKRMSHHLNVLGTFSWSKMMDSAQYLNAQDPAPIRYEDSLPNLRGNLAVIYQLPAFSNSPAFVRSIIGGWQANGILRAYNGYLLNNPGGMTKLSNPRLAHPTYSRFFNTCYLNAAGAMVMTTNNAPGCDSASSTPAFQQHYAFTLSDTGPVMTGVRQRVHPDTDVSLFKVFKIHERATFEIRGEFFNVLNTPNFGSPGGSPGSSSYGVVTRNQLNDPRLGQLTARFNF